MKNCLFFLFLLPFLALSQTEKGASPIPNTSIPNTQTTYAVVIGISDYQDEGIPDLRFADKDALAFAGFLQSPAGGSLDEDHLKVLVNEKATQAQFAATLDWLWEVAEENDKVIIYFSGHGDVERKSFTQPGYLLCWDAPPNVYMGGGAFNVRDLNDVVSTISIQNKAKVILVTDACRAGKLSGSNIGGSQATAANLAKQYGNEIKILSCQPDEYSIEGEQWGGGRGAFSYHLLDGLYGMADGNNDQSVNLLEIGRYLEDKVTAEVAPQSQIPMTIGGRGEKITDVFPEILAQLKEGRKGQIQLFNATESRGVEEDVLAEADTTTVELYFAFQESLKEKQFLEPSGACAEAYYEKLVREPTLERLHSSMQRNYAAALQDDAQQVMNKILKMDQEELTLSRLNQMIKYSLYPRYLERAAELLGETHYMYPILKARKLYFEAFLMHIDNRDVNRELGETILAKYRAALRWQPEFPHVFSGMATVHFRQMQQVDSAEHYTHLAAEMAPAWVLPFSGLGYMYSEPKITRNADRSRHFLELANKLDPDTTNLIHLANWSTYYMQFGQTQKAEQVSKKIIQKDSTKVFAYECLGIVCMYTNRYKEAINYLKKAVDLDPTNRFAQTNLGNSYLYTFQLTAAEKHFRIAIDLDSTFLYAQQGMALVYIGRGQFDKAQKQTNKIFQIDSAEIEVYLNLGNAYSIMGQYQKAEQYLLKASQLNPEVFTDYDGLAWICIKTGRFEEAESYINKSLDKGWTKTLNVLALIYIKTGRYQEAAITLEKSMTINQDDVKYTLLTYAVLYGQQQQFDQAFDYLERALQAGYYKNDLKFLVLERDVELAPLREQKERWEALMKKY